LAVVDDVDAGVDLLPDDVGDGPAHTRPEGAGVGRGPAVERFQQRREVGRPRKAAGVRREDAVGAALHGVGASSCVMDPDGILRPRSMVKVLTFLKRKPGMAVEEFQRYWLTRHPQVVTRLPGVR